MRPKSKNNQIPGSKTPKSQTNSRLFVFEEVQPPQQILSLQKAKSTSAGVKKNKFFSPDRYLTSQSYVNTNENQRDNSQSEYSRASMNNYHCKTEYTNSQLDSASLVFSKHKSSDNKLTNSLDQGNTGGSPFFHPYPQKKPPTASGPKDFGFQLDLSALGNSTSYTSSKNSSQLTKPLVGNMNNEDLIAASHNTTIKVVDRESHSEAAKSMKNMREANNEEKKTMFREKSQTIQSKEVDKATQPGKSLGIQQKYDNTEGLSGEFQELKGKVNKMQESITRFQQSFSKVMEVQDEVNKKLLTILAEDSSSRGTEYKKGSELETIRDYCSEGSEPVSSRTPESNYASVSDRNQTGGTSSRGNLESYRTWKESQRGSKKGSLDFKANRPSTFGEEKLVMMDAFKRTNKDQLPSSEKDNFQ